MAAIQLNETLNPYQPPAPVGFREPWWRRITRRFTRPRIKRKPRFERGEAIIHEGVAFFMDRDDPTLLHAALPSSEASADRMDRIVAEALRVLPKFLRDNPSVHPLVRGRRLAVRMIATYAELKMELFARAELGEEVLANSLPLGDYEKAQ